ncbi:hypothetical protein QQZ08_007159 [Neonectria magnoliae]|uniref:Uncharacterized protein n=1 Tax=Neonectria magnoliae TaxID=2732573 RepID=A0ABR1HZJ5_9HYPO
MTLPNTTNESRAAVAKDNTRTSATGTPPPPAYTPRRADLAALTARAIQARHPMSNVAEVLQRGGTLQTTLLGSAAAAAAAAAAADEDPDNSPIYLRINTAVTVTRSNNVVCLASNPSDQANAIAKAVVEALHKNSAGMCGIPMIDENGCPRPLRIEVDAGLSVEGSGNIIGSQDLVVKALEERNAESSGNAAGSSGAASFSSAENSGRRARVEDDQADEENPAKRQRSSE